MKKNVGLLAAICTVMLSVSCDYINDLGIEAGLNDGLMVYWPVTESSGNIVKDYSGNGRSLTLNSTTYITFIKGKFGNALNYWGTSSSTSSYNDPDLLKGSNSFTISMWVNLSIETDEGRFLILTQAIDPILNITQGLSSTDIILTMTVGNGAGGMGSVSCHISQDTWTFMTFIFTGDKSFIYVNGEFESDLPAEVTLPSIDSFTLGGNYSENIPIDGYLDEIRIYNRALSEDEIKKLMTVGMD